ncbi:hypothetical protein ANO14919_145630 [Xylariales sp. No.14919]|nr:hypothetical protein ANO14919_145630 [Xylariales sp. No.14919]
MPLDGFVQIGPNIFLYTPPAHQAGQLVVLCTWMGAADKHVVKYTNVHRKNAPNAKILLIRSFVGSMISSYSRQERGMKVAAHAICQVLGDCGSVNPHMMLHMMSNGGANSATNLLVILQRQLKRPLPLIGVLCDSTPTSSSYSNTVRAFTHSFPRTFPLNIIGYGVIHFIISLLFLSIAMGRYEAPEDYWRESILDKSLVESNRICYIASKADELTGWQDVVSHAEEARERGWDVQQYIFNDTSHCNHISKHEDVYIKAVKDLWMKRKL